MGEVEQKKKRTITEIRDSKRTGEKMVYMSVPDYTSAQWAETAGVDVAVVGDSLAMIAHGHANTIPATMEMMIMHSMAVRRGAPNTFVLGCMPYQSYNTVDRALVNATRFMQEAGCDAVKPQGGKSQGQILKALVDAGIPTAVKPGWPVDGYGPPWFMAELTATPVGILSLSNRPTRWRSGPATRS